MEAFKMYSKDNNYVYMVPVSSSHLVYACNYSCSGTAMADKHIEIKQKVQLFTSAHITQQSFPCVLQLENKQLPHV